MLMGTLGRLAGCVPLGFSAYAGDFTGDYAFLSCAVFFISRLQLGSVVCG